MVKVTPKAIKKLKEEINKQSQPEEELFVRLTMGIGWGGAKLSVALEESPLSKDIVIEEDGIKFLINESDKVYFQDTKLDYLKNILGYGNFELLNI